MKRIKTSFGNIAISESGNGNISIIFIHGNSACKEVFQRQMESNLLKKYHLLSLDLIGHGDSDDSKIPQNDYTLRSYAQLLNEIVEHMKLTEIILVGWSLGGHIAIEALSQGMIARGLVLCGTPPVGGSLEYLGLAFKSEDVMELTGKEILSHQEVDTYSSAIMGGVKLVSKKISQAVARTDGKTRSVMLNDFAQNCAYYNQQSFIETWTNPIAVLQGDNDAFLQLDFLDNLNWKNLWHGEVVYFKGIGHAPFWEAPDKFNVILSEFFDDIANIATSE
jgi:pimeloyl-ACP methyl ester carboxylesterase